MAEIAATAKVPVGAWVQAARLRTLPLCLACVGMGNFLAASEGQLNPYILLLSLFTTLFLQVLSNFANDLGDAQNGADSHLRTGPARAVQSGLISASQMKRAVLLLGILSLLSGIALLAVSSGNLTRSAVFIMLAVGLAAIAAAVFYTAGKRPYGYAGFGDVSVFLFFGITGVLGTAFLHLGYVWGGMLLPAISMGLLSTAVLNVNNMRDVVPDAAAGKQTFALRLGQPGAKIYHSVLVIGALVAACIYSLWANEGFNPIQGILLFPIALHVRNMIKIWKAPTNEALDAFLKPTAIGTLLLSFCLGITLL